MSAYCLVDRDSNRRPVVTMSEAAPDGPEGEVVVAVRYSSLNYKDALALAGNPGVVRRWPLVPGIDAVGTVVSDSTGTLPVGESVTVNGGGLGESRHGGFGPQVNAPSASVVSIPKPLTEWDAAALGTAGYTAALCMDRLAHGHVTPCDGPLLVTGGTGGVGSVAIMLAHDMGFEVHAATTTLDAEDYLMELGASSIVDAREFAAHDKPLASATYAGAIDCVGSAVLAAALAHVQPEGVVATCGLAGGADLRTTVMPFILRGVTLAGVNSVDVSRERRLAAWERLSHYVDRDLLARLTTVIDLSEVEQAAAAMLSNSHRGRLIVDISR